jgi:hypothetical protein
MRLLRLPVSTPRLPGEATNKLPLLSVLQEHAKCTEEAEQQHCEGANDDSDKETR